MKSISGKAFCKIVEKQGWVLKRISGSHHIYTKEGVQAILSIPVHGNRDLPIGILTKLMKDANLTEDDLKK
ncbi:MAG: type II toxin-antitoxin system HicA family toxin [Okeania sp. SIO3I5]|uniref:type II toxin-antitoxin system HicA family toxin n=1 Tax=Okeania sp. SIO3I5 TaxID=2607805 RepID=UPI0013B859C3|nr:type II toxin-antitoxin system HicA family toxin [Okeania sp. SIO3I5]NEQ38477.1 type II toxin-antitoxin system HicA family toxin [Okeania sp. SIO3I5]